METPTGLNSDVLAIVCKFLTRVEDVLSVSLTCSAIRPVAIRHLLQIHPISLTCSSSIRRFHYFLFADLPARAPHIRALEIGSQRFHSPNDTESPGEYFQLVELLSSCLHLERILLSTKDTSPRPSDDGNPSIPNAIITTRQAKPTNVHTLLPMVRAPLRALTIRTINPEDLHWTPPALEEFLPNFASTLETLELCSLYIDIPDAQGLDGSSLPPSGSPLTQYTAVHSLSVRTLEGVPLLDVLLHQFPALDGTLSLPEWGRTTYLSSRRDIRECNQQAQQRRGDNVWKKLDRLVCEPVLFHLLGLRCPIGLLMIDRGGEEMKDDLALALRENPVARLKLSFMLDPGLTVFDSLLHAGLGGTLTHLTFCLMDTQSTHSFCDAEGMTVTGLQWDDILVRP